MSTVPIAEQVQGLLSELQPAVDRIVSLNEQERGDLYSALDVMTVDQGERGKHMRDFALGFVALADDILP